jgi:hypothetical protein
MAEKAHDPIALMCRVLGVSRSGLYAWTRCPMPACHQPPLLRAQALASRVSRPLRGVAPQRAQALRELHGPRRPSTCHQELRDCQQVAPGRQPSPWSSAGPSRVAQLAWPGGAGPARAPAPSRVGPLAETQGANGAQQHILPPRNETRPPPPAPAPPGAAGARAAAPRRRPTTHPAPAERNEAPLRPLRPLLALRGHAPPPRGGAQQHILPPRTRNEAPSNPAAPAQPLRGHAQPPRGGAQQHILPPRTRHEAGCPKGCRPR